MNVIINLLLIFQLLCSVREFVIDKYTVLLLACLSFTHSTQLKQDLKHEAERNIKIKRGKGNKKQAGENRQKLSDEAQGFASSADKSDFFSSSLAFTKTSTFLPLSFALQSDTSGLLIKPQVHVAHLSFIC